MGFLDHLSDEQLVDRANAGQAEAFDALYRRHRDHVLRQARRYTHDEALAQDAAQETFLYLLGKFPPPPSNRLTLTAKLTTLLYPVIKHTALRARDKQRRLRLSTSADLAETHDEPAAAPRDAFTSGHDLSAVLARLSDEHRELVLLRFVDDLTIPEIARRVGIPPGTVKSRLHHAVAQLRDDPATKKFFDE